MLSNHSTLALLISRSFGVSSKSKPTLPRIRPGLTKLAWPWILLGRRSGTRLSRWVRLTPSSGICLPLPVAEFAAGEVGIVHDGVEAGGVVVVDVVVARRP